VKNQEVARLLREIADYLELQDVEYKPRAYRRAARSVESTSEPIEDVYERGELEDVEGVGASIASKVAEYLETGELEYYEALRADLPVDIEALTSVEGMGPKTAKRLYRELGVSDLSDLEAAAEAGEIAPLNGFGEASERNVLEHVGRAKAGEERMLLGRAFPIAEELASRLRGTEPFERVDVVGSFRRRRPTVGDLDVLASASDATAAMDAICEHEEVKEVLARGDTKSSVVVSGDLQVDVRIVDEEEYGSALVYFTGSKDHNIALRNRAIDRDWKLNEYGLFDVADVDEEGQRVGERIASGTETAVYDALDLPWLPPELRENTGELAAADAGELPSLVDLDDVRGDLQVHTTYSDGARSVAEMAAAAEERGLEYVLVTDHGPNAPIPQRLDADAFDEQVAAVETANEDVNVTVLQGIEAEVTDEGVTTPPEMLSACDVVVAALHGRPSDPTTALVDAVETSAVDVLAHPSNRLVHEREPLDADWDAVMGAASDAGVAVEVNAQPERLDLAWHAVKEYRDTVQYVVSTDAHATGELDFMHLGVAQLRRGWCEPADVLNTRPLDDLRAWLAS
jgi:DNA polymerase (family 10)